MASTSALMCGHQQTKNQFDVGDAFEFWKYFTRDICKVNEIENYFRTITHSITIRAKLAHSAERSAAHFFSPVSSA